MPTSAEQPIILLVDDDPDTLHLLRRLIAAFAPHTEVVAVHRANAALTTIATRPIALVITDYHMPGMDGVQLTRLIKQIAPTTRVAIASVNNLEDVRRAAETVAADYVLSKPFMIAELKQMITESMSLGASQ